jgi:hypothetical protein
MGLFVAQDAWYSFSFRAEPSIAGPEIAKIAYRRNNSDRALVMMVSMAVSAL